MAGDAIVVLQDTDPGNDRASKEHPHLDGPDKRTGAIRREGTTLLRP